AFLGVITIGGMNVLITRLKMRFPTFGSIVDGTPVAVIENGDVYRERLSMLRITEQDLMAAARAKGISEIEKIRYAFVERNGSITILPFEEG
ncbi:MAG TPA: YetF domain-containing protein, partial [Verrucomicrobiae bacterium]|nr:YetF domain-containing protein [Verrucomicrobiae bacterium]